jgi:hypothetical protein
VDEKKGEIGANTMVDYRIDDGCFRLDLRREGDKRVRW